jgi:hypothetical protein
VSIAHRCERFWFEPQPPLNLGVCRVLFFALMCVMFLALPIRPFAEVGTSSVYWDPVFLLKVAEKIAHVLHLPIIAPAPVMGLIGIVWKLSLMMACVGLFTRASTIIAFVLGTYITGLSNSYGKIESQLLPLIFIMGFLALSRCGDAVSLDAIFRRRRRPIAPSGEYRWPVRMVWVLMAVIFFNAGTAKLRHSGYRWAWAENFQLLLITQFYNANPPVVRIGLFIANHVWLARLFAAGSLCVETLFPLALFTRWGRWFFPLAAFGMQVGIGLLMNIWFVGFLGAYLFWVPWDKVIDRLTGRSRAGEPSPRAAIGGAAA